MMNLSPHIVTIFVIFNLTTIYSANILAILPMVEKSHYVMYGKIIEELARRGHILDIIGGIPSSFENNVTGLNFIKFPSIQHTSVPPLKINDIRKFTTNYAMKFLLEVHATQICKEGFQTEVMRNLKQTKKKYDLLLIELFIVDCLFGFSHIFDAPVVSMVSSTDLPWGGHRIGNPDNPSYIPIYFQGLRPHQSLYDRFWNTLCYIQTKFGHWLYTREQQEISKQFFGRDMPDLEDIIANISILLVNSHFSLNMARPSVPNFIEVGGLHIERQLKPLNKKIREFIGNEKFIYFSFGSIVNSETFESDILENFMNTFSRMDYKVLWKANREKMTNNVTIPRNILIHEWMPQMDILCHPNILLFITHAGLLGIQEAIHCEVPMLCLPLFADQYQNCHNMVDKGVAKTLEVETITEEVLSNALQELTEDKRYKQNAEDLSKQFKDRPLPPLETSMYWIEYVLRHNGAPHLKSPSIKLKWYQYYLVDVTTIFVALFLFSLCFTYICIKLFERIIINLFLARKDMKKID